MTDDSSHPGDFEKITAALDELTRRIDTYRQEAAPYDGEAILVELETAREELRVADEEVRTQQAELDRLIQRQALARTARERFAVRIPTPVIITDQNGIIIEANPATVETFGLPLHRLRRKPIFGFVGSENRWHIRRRLSQAVVEHHEEFHCVATIAPRGRDTVAVELAATIRWDEDAEQVEVVWVLIGPEIGISPRDRTHTELAVALAELAAAPIELAQRELLQHAVECCEKAFRPPTFASIVIGDPAAPDVVVAGGPEAQHLDGTQVVAGEGPTATAHSTWSLVSSHDLRSDERWPQLASRLAEDKPVAVVAVPIGADRGVLCLYFDDTPDLPTIAEGAGLLATSIAGLLHDGDVRTELQTLAEQLQTAMKSRATIDQAKGIIMARQGVDADEAFQVLARASSKTNVRLRELAQRLVEQVGKESRSEPG